MEILSCSPAIWKKTRPRKKVSRFILLLVAVLLIFFTVLSFNLVGERPHMSSEGCKRLQTAGRSGFPKSWQRLSTVNCTQRTPAGFPFGIPGMADVMDGAIQHAPQPTRQFMG